MDAKPRLKRTRFVSRSTTSKRYFPRLVSSTAWEALPGQGSGSIGIADVDGDGAGLTFQHVTMNAGGHVVDNTPDDVLAYTTFYSFGDAVMRLDDVTLTGKVPSRRMKHRVEDLVADMSGVRDLDNQLKVSMFGPKGDDAVVHQDKDDPMTFSWPPV